jgi:sucrose phosphorylase
MKEIEHLISKIYSTKDLEKIIGDIQILINKYKNLKNYTIPKLNNKDVVLISYGDQVYEKNGNKKLVSLHNLLNKYLKEQISIVHILPFYPSTSDDGFSVKDYYAVDSTLGTWHDINSMAKDYKLLFDAVINHNSSSSEWFKEYLNGNKSFKDYYIEVDELADYSQVVRPRVSPLTHVFKSKEKEVKIWTTFSQDQVDLNYKNYKVFIHILDLLAFYVSKGASIIRLDAVGFLWKEKNSKSIHLPQTHNIIKMMNLFLKKINQNIKILTETNVPHIDNISYFGDGDEADMVYNFTLPPLLAYSLLSEKTDKFSEWVKGLKTPFDNVCYFNFLSSHDGIGVFPVEDILNTDETKLLLESAKANGGRISYKSLADGSKKPYEINCNYLNLLFGINTDEDLGVRRSILAHALLLTMPGLPAIYFHSLFGSLNDIKGMKESGQNRRINREKFSTEYIDSVLSDKKSRQFKILSFIKNLIDIRKYEEAFDVYGFYEVIDTTKGIFAIKRKGKSSKQDIWAYFNFTQDDKTVLIDSGIKWIDLITKETYTNQIKIQGLNGAWLKQM